MLQTLSDEWNSFDTVSHRQAGVVRDSLFI